MKTSVKFVFLILISLIIVLMGVAFGSGAISFADTLAVLSHKLLGQPAPPPEIVSVVWNLRLPRVITSFLVGAALSLSGTVMQSVLQNPLASSFTLGVSSGAALGAALVIVTGISFAQLFTLPLVSFVFALGTVVLAIVLTTVIDGGLQNQTIVLIGMVVSLFLNAILTFVTSFHKDYAYRLVSWQMGNLAGTKWSHVGILFPVTFICSLLLMGSFRELDIMTFGDTQSQSIGVNTKGRKWFLLMLSALLTGAAVCFVGVIGFVDLIAPHIMRRWFGPSHRKILPASALFGGSFLVLADLISRTIVAPIQLSVGAVTAVIGAPFFAYVFFRTRKKVSV